MSNFSNLIKMFVCQKMYIWVCLKFNVTLGAVQISREHIMASAWPPPLYDWSNTSDVIMPAGEAGVGPYKNSALNNDLTKFIMK